MIDLPKMTGPDESTRTCFYDDLVYYLQASEMYADVITKLEQFDFSKTKSFAFVHTM